MEFGEVVIQSSRAFWDDYDEIMDEREPMLPLEWVWQNEENIPRFPSIIENLLIIEGFSIDILDFFNSILLKNRSPLCSLRAGNASIYEYPELNLTVCIVNEKEVNYFTPITEALLPWLSKANNVYALAFHPLAQYKGEEMSQKPIGSIIRGINSTLKEIKNLEAPNIVTGVSAAALTYRKCNHKSASCFAIYMETCIFDSTSSIPVIQLLQHLNIPCNKTYTCKHKSVTGLYL